MKEREGMGKERRGQERDGNGEVERGQSKVQLGFLRCADPRRKPTPPSH